MKYAIVLGTAQYDGRPSRILAGRLRHAGELATAEGRDVITGLKGHFVWINRCGFPGQPWAMPGSCF
nr:hypothetical protein [Corynebacterium tuberculostearicum]